MHIKQHFNGPGGLAAQRWCRTTGQCAPDVGADKPGSTSGSTSNRPCDSGQPLMCLSLSFPIWKKEQEFLRPEHVFGSIEMTCVKSLAPRKQEVLVIVLFCLLRDLIIVLTSQSFYLLCRWDDFLARCREPLSCRARACIWVWRVSEGWVPPSHRSLPR